MKPTGNRFQFFHPTSVLGALSCSTYPRFQQLPTHDPFSLSSFTHHPNQSPCKPIMTEFQITKKWRERGKLLRSIIHGTLLGNNKFKLNFKFKSFSFHADDHKVHDSVDHHQQSSVFYKVGLLPSLVRVPSRGLKKIGRAVSMRKHEDEDVSFELCKKRIMMGKKCRPLNVSGALYYDKNGVLVPEAL